MSRMTQRHLDRLLTPKSVAIFGASDKPARVGTTVWRNLVAGGFKGPLAPVNPRLQELDGMRCYGDVAELPFTPDLAVLCTPPDTIAPSDGKTSGLSVTAFDSRISTSAAWRS